MAATVVDGEKAVMASGVSTKPLYIKHLSLEDWDLIKRLQVGLGNKSVADTVRFCIRKAVNAPLG